MSLRLPITDIFFGDKGIQVVMVLYMSAVTWEKTMKGWLHESDMVRREELGFYEAFSLG